MVKLLSAFDCGRVCTLAPCAPSALRTLCLGLLVGASSAFGAAEALDVAPGVAGILETPASGDTRGAVLLIHGWNGHKDEVGDLYKDLAESLADAGLASLRFDFTGEGPQNDFVVSSTYAQRIAEAEAAFALLRERVPGVPMGANGFSLGGFVAMTLAGLHPDWFDTIVLWSAASRMDFSGGDPAMVAAVQQALAEGEGVYETWEKLTLTREFIVSYLGKDASRGLERYPGSLLAIRGTADYLPALDRDWIAATPGRNDAVIYIDGADHIFNVLDQPKPDYGPRAIAHSVEWLSARLAPRSEDQGSNASGA